MKKEFWCNKSWNAMKSASYEHQTKRSDHIYFKLEIKCRGKKANHYPAQD